MMIKFVTNIALAFVVTAFGLTANSAIAASNYQVEVLIFNYLPSDTLDDEIWPEIKEVPFRSGARKLRYNKEGTDFFTRLPKSSLQLNDKKAHLKRSPQYRIIFHEAWIQPVGSIKGKDTVHITGGDILDNGLYELEGYISVDKARYLHFRTDLFHTRQLTAQESQLLTPKTEEPGNTPVEFVGLVTDLQNNPLDSANGNRYLTSTEIPDFVTVEMKTGRRMRRDELHYLDHPLMGALVLISAVEE
ncbi:MAG: CsiV family protein [Amphritea sp.]